MSESSSQPLPDTLTQRIGLLARRDLMDGFNSAASLTRTQTIMQGAPCCNFRYGFGGEADG